jgi:integrase
LSHPVLSNLAKIGGIYGGKNMGCIAKALAPIEIGRITKAGYNPVGTVPGLYLNVTANGSRSWVLRITVGSKRREIGLGPYPAVTLANAHGKARQARELIAQGIDPVEDKKAKISTLKADQAKAITFETAAKAYIKAIESEWRNTKHGAQWSATLENYAYPKIGKMLVKDIDLPQVLSVLEPIWRTKTVTAARLRGRVEAVLNWATTRGYRTGENPARWRGHLDTLLPAPNKIKGEEHHPTVRLTEAGAFMRDLRAKVAVGARALEFTMLTAARSGEVRGAVWSEIDMEAKLWTIPAGRMKSGVEHREPLCETSVALLKALTKVKGSDFVFTSPRGRMLSDMTMSKLMKGMGYKARDGRLAVPHGLRGTFKVWAQERTSYPREVIEMALSHALENKVEAAYFDSDLLDKRARLMAEWASFLAKVETSTSVVTPINKKTA